MSETLFCPDEAAVVDAHLAELRAAGVRFVTQESLSRALVSTLPYDAYGSPERYAAALLRAVDEDVRAGGIEVAA